MLGFVLSVAAIGVDVMVYSQNAFDPKDHPELRHTVVEEMVKNPRSVTVFLLQDLQVKYLNEAHLETSKPLPNDTIRTLNDRSAFFEKFLTAMGGVPRVFVVVYSTGGGSGVGRLVILRRAQARLYRRLRLHRSNQLHRSSLHLFAKNKSSFVFAKFSD